MLRFEFAFGIGIVWLTLFEKFVGLLDLESVVFTLLIVRWVPLLEVC